MVQSSVHYQKLSSDISNEPESDQCEQESEEDEARIYLQPPIILLSRRKGQRRSWIRLIIALLLLSIALGFVVCEWYRCGTENKGLQSQEPCLDHGHLHHKHDENAVHSDEEGEEYGHGHHHHSGFLFHHAAVITDSVSCSRVGKEVLQRGGNVVDAGIAAVLCLGVLHPHTAGLGGVFSAILYNHTSRSFRAARPSCPQMALNSYGIPATLQVIKELHSLYGHSTWRSLFEDAIKLAKDGFLIDEVLSKALETNKNKILHSKLCDLFCDGSGHVKAVDSCVTNRNLSELLQALSQNDTHTSEILAKKLADDLAPSERPDLVDHLQRCGAKIGEPFIMEKENYTVVSSASQLKGTIVSDILEQMRVQSFSFQSSDLSSIVTSAKRLLKLAQNIYSNIQASEKLGLQKVLAINTTSSHVGVLDGHGNFVVLSTSLNSTWGSGQFLPSSGVILSDFTLNLDTDLAHLSFPLVVKTKDDDVSNDDDNYDEKEVNEHLHHGNDNDLQLVAVTGGFDALFHAAVIVRLSMDYGVSSLEVMRNPVLHFVLRDVGSLFGCLSTTFNGSDVRLSLSEEHNQLQEVDKCPVSSLSMLLKLHLGHVGAYGAPASKAHSDGY